MSIPRVDCQPRVLILVPGFVRGGPIIGVYTLVKQLCARGLRPDILALDRAGQPSMEDEFRRLPVAVQALSQSRISFQSSAFRLARFLRTRRYDVLHTTLLRPDVLSALIVPWLNGARTVSTVRSRFGEELAFFQGRLASAATAGVWRASLARKDIVVPHSEAIRESLAAGGLSPAKVTVINNGVDVERFRPPTAAERIEAREQLGLPRDPTIVLHVGRLTRLKGVDTLLRALADVPSDLPLLFVSAGDGEEAESLRSLARRL